MFLNKNWNFVPPPYENRGYGTVLPVLENFPIPCAILLLKLTYYRLYTRCSHTGFRSGYKDNKDRNNEFHNPLKNLELINEIDSAM